MGQTTDTGGAGAGPRRPSRRIVLRTAFTVGVTAGTAAVLAPVLTGDSEPVPPSAKSGGTEPERFAEMYRGREIRGTATVMAPLGGPGGTVRAAGAGAPDAVPHVEVRVDGRPLHIMRRADGSYVSHANHYESFPTLLATARAAVDEIGSARLSAVPPRHSV
ncbi:tyrosinase cofactor [Streptomyces sp. NBC_00234]|uniref:tyrosinase family oxidase copper chaperone n=1 Tax=Streptomyces sp. NBC_00234 TaxID=2903638 RepID=UPI002E2E51A1|nr:tyrosinase family oxidase copper chaperone [Streptomyces sp. NBC_00234]